MEFTIIKTRKLRLSLVLGKINAYIFLKLFCSIFGLARQSSAIKRNEDGGTRNRTLANGFGDRCSTTKLYPPIQLTAYSKWLVFSINSEKIKCTRILAIATEC